MKMKNAVSVVLWVLFINFILAGCSEKEAEGKYQFLYFPKTNTYYDVAAGQYLYSLDSARTWNSIAESSSEPAATLGNSHVIHSDEKQVWKENEAHRQQFGGSIFNIISASNTVAAAEAGVAERKVVARKPTPRPAAEEKPKKKGLRKFFNNLFGKKDKQE